MLGMGSGWWSVTGQVLDIVGFVWLTIDLVPEFAATSARQLLVKLETDVRAAFARAKDEHLNDLPAENRAFAEAAMSIAYDRNNSPGRLTQEVFDAALREVPGATKAGGVYWEAKLGWLDLAYLGEKVAGKGMERLAQAIPPTLWADQQSMLTQAEQDSIRATYDAVMARANFRRLWNPLRRKAKARGDGEGEISLLMLADATDRIGELDQFLGRRRRWLLMPAALIIFGFAAQVWGSIPVEDEHLRITAVPAPWYYAVVQ